MRSPLWILNIGLVILFLVVLVLINVTRQQLPARKSLTISPAVTPIKKDVSALDLRLIYENDLFRTYVKPVVPVHPEKPVVKMPPPPLVQTAPPIMTPQVQFLEPLRVVLKGIMYGTNELDNRAIIADQQTAQEKLYAVGDTVGDAEIIKIESNQVLLLRSNGQQEVLFLTQKIAKGDPLYSKNNRTWSEVALNKGAGVIIVDPQALAQKITSLAEFIDMLDITSVVNTVGLIEGMHIGALAPRSLGEALGLQEGDVIKQVHGIDATTMQNRVMIYQALKNLALGSTIPVRLVRGNQEHTLTIVLQNLKEVVSAAPVREEGAHLPESSEDITRHLENLPRGPNLLEKMHEQDRDAMRRFGGKNSLIQRTVSPRI